MAFGLRVPSRGPVELNRYDGGATDSHRRGLRGGGSFPKHRLPRHPPPPPQVCCWHSVSGPVCFLFRVLPHGRGGGGAGVRTLGSNDWAPRTRKRHQREHRPQRPTERSDPTQHAEGRTGDRPGPRK